MSPPWSNPRREVRKIRNTARPDFLSMVAFSSPTPLLYPRGDFPTHHQRPSALGAGDSIPCSGTAVSGIQSSAWSLCRQHPEGGAREGIAEVRGQPVLAQRCWPPALKEAHGVTDIQNTEINYTGCGIPKGTTPNLVRGGGTSEITHSSWDLIICQVPEVLPALSARSHSPILRLHPHFGDQIEL